jgi:L-aminopeptidase/D-esterase-like protein
MEKIPFTDVEGIKLGHAHDLEAATGCTVVICEEGATGGVDVRGGAPGTRETDLLQPQNLIEKIHAVVLTGGSAFGLDAAAGVMQYLEERGVGFNVGVTTVPIVCSAVLFDLAIGSHRVRPDREMGYEACRNAGSPVAEGNVGCGAGATVGKILGMDRAMKSGLGTCGLRAGNLTVSALVAVNCLGDVVDPRGGRILAGARADDGSFLDTESVMASAYAARRAGENTTLAVIATNARLTKAQANKVASMAQDGIARTMRPAHSMYDGDTVFTMATCRADGDVSFVGAMAARVLERAVIRAVTIADPLAGLPSHTSLFGPYGDVTKD